ncbi:exodeoxyribonuclease I [Spirochaetota bacterium]
MAKTILWYDLETFGLNPRHDRIAQFACIRTNERLEPVSEQLILYSRISDDYLPSPRSCLVHRISPQDTIEKGIPEYEFAKAIRTEMMATGSCTCGYNSIAFDDEFIRNLFYRNLFDPYEREWAEGNSRWDVMDLFRAARDLKPDGLAWPDGVDGKPDFRLTSLANANSVKLRNAHNAMHDIEATLALVRLVKKAQPRLYDWYWKHKTRDSLRPLIKLAACEPILHSSASYTRKEGCSTIIAPVGMLPRRRDAVLALDLRYDPEPLIKLDVEEIRTRVFSPKTTMKDGDRIPLSVVRLGRCPYLAPLSVLDKKAALRLGLDPEEAKSRAKSLSGEVQLIQKLLAVFSPIGPEIVEPDPDYRIYSGGFFRDDDRDSMAAVHEAIAALGPKEARPQAYSLPFWDERLPKLVRRLFARNWLASLSRSEKERWRSYCAGRLLFPGMEGATDLASYEKTIAALLDSMDTVPEDKAMLMKLLDYKLDLETRIFTYQKEDKPIIKSDKG